MKNIYIDMDNTLCKTHEHFKFFLYTKGFITKDEYLDGRQIDTESYVEFIMKYGFSKEEAEYIKFHIYGMRDFWETIPAHDGALYVVSNLFNNKLKCGYDIFIATSVFNTKSEACYCGKISWIKERMPYFSTLNVIYTHYKYNLKGFLLFEDLPQQLAGFDGLQVLFRKPYNESYKEEADYVVDDWYQFGNYVTERTKT